jgi:hypothetical protein
LRGCKIKLKLTDAITHKIKFLCREISKEEWSGVLFYSVKGSIADPVNMEITLENLYPMDKGSGGATSYMYNEDVVGFRMDNPETNFMKIGHIHSHNSMGVFFSGTDTSELNDNVVFHNYYLSVIVNNFFEIDARIAFVGHEDYSLISGKNEDGEPYSLKLESKREVMFYYQCDIVRETFNLSVDDSFCQRVQEIIKEAAKPKNFAPNFQQGTSPQLNAYGLGHQQQWGTRLSEPIIFDTNKINGTEDEAIQQQEDDDDEIKDFLVDLITSHPQILTDEMVQYNPILSLDDAFAYIDNHIPRNKTQYKFMDWVIEELPEVYASEFEAEGEPDTFIEDLNRMIQIIEEYSTEYRSAHKLNQALCTMETRVKSLTNG